MNNDRTNPDDEQVRALMEQHNFRYPMGSRLAALIRDAWRVGQKSHAAQQDVELRRQLDRAERVVRMVNVVRKQAEVQGHVTLVKDCAMFTAAQALDEPR